MGLVDHFSCLLQLFSKCICTLSPHIRIISFLKR